jgi:hypothetical protein
MWGEMHVGEVRTEPPSERGQRGRRVQALQEGAEGQVTSTGEELGREGPSGS